MRCEVTDDERTSHDGCRAEHLRIGTRFASEAKACAYIGQNSVDASNRVKIR